MSRTRKIDDIQERYDELVGKTTGVATDHGGLSGLSDNDHPQYLLVANKDSLWPVGCCFMATVATNPATLLGFGTWELKGVGDLTLT